MTEPETSVPGTPRVRLIHWNAAEAREREAWLRAAGYEPAAGALDAGLLRRLERDPPIAVVIDLSRLPGQGRDVGLAIRTRRATRHLPLVFVGGDHDKVSRIRGHLPDAIYAAWSGIDRALKRAISRPPQSPVVPPSVLAGYAGVPLAKKLGIREGSAVVLAGAPEGFEAALGALPAGATVRRRGRGRRDLTIWFARSRGELKRRLGTMTAFAGRGGLWIAWPKKSAAPRAGLTQAEVRRAGLGSGLVDFKICAIDATWAGLRFTRRDR